MKCVEDIKSFVILIEKRYILLKENETCSSIKNCSKSLLTSVRAMMICVEDIKSFVILMEKRYRPSSKTSLQSRKRTVQNTLPMHLDKNIFNSSDQMHAN